MIERLSLQNFKGFRELPSLHMKPITVLCGTNSSGKSSILQSILLLKQTFESQNPNQTMLLNGRFVHLGVFENIIYQKDSARSVTLDLSSTITFDDASTARARHSVPLSLYLENLFTPLGREPGSASATRYVVHYRVSVRSSVGDGKKAPLRPIIVDGLECRVEQFVSNQDTPSETKIRLSLTPNGTYVASWDRLRNPFVGHARSNAAEEVEISSGMLEGLGVEVANLFPISITPNIEKGKASGETPVPPALIWMYRMLNDVLLAIFSSYAYIGPLREEPSRRYIYEDEIVEIGIKGENAAYIYLSEQDRHLSDHYFFTGDDASPFSIKSRPRLAHAVNQWLDQMDIHGLKPEATNEMISLNLDASVSGRTRVNIADVGFGVSQIFPIIVEGLRMPRGHTLLLEQPEIHLHPNLQMQMADYFISLALSGKKVLVETHSDHIVNRLLRRIVENEGDDLSKLIGMYFVRATPEGASVEEVRIDPTEGVVNWPRDFFDQAASEQERTIQASVRRRGRKRRAR